MESMAERVGVRLFGGRRITIATKLLGGFAILVALVMVLGVFSISRMGRLDAAAQTVFHEDLQSITAVAEIGEAVLDVEGALSTAVLAALVAQEIGHEDPELADELKAEAIRLLTAVNDQGEAVTLLIAGISGDHGDHGGDGAMPDMSGDGSGTAQGGAAPVMEMSGDVPAGETAEEAHGAAAPAADTPAADTTEEADGDHAASLSPTNLSPTNLVLAGAEPDDGEVSVNDLFAALNSNWQVFVAQLDQVNRDFEAGALVTSGATVVNGEGSRALAAAIRDISMLRDRFETAAAASAADASDTYQTARTLTLIGIGIALLVAASVGLLLAQSLSRGIARVANGLSLIARGELDETVTIATNDELGDMARSYGEMQAYLREMAGIATAVSTGDVSVTPNPRSERDVLGHAFVEMQDYLHEAATAAARIAEGDLTVDVKPRSEADALGRSFHSMIGTLSTMLGRTAEAVSSLIVAKDKLADAASQSALATTETAKTTAQVAEGTSQQAESVQDLSVAVEKLNTAAETLEDKARTEVSAAADQVAVGAAEASARAQDATSAAHSGSEKMQNTVDGIDRIRDAMDSASTEVAALGEQSTEIGKIVAVIEDIAAQTNLLALNAAIEAARAGEEGRGFAVVADEVRKLAERVSQATKEIASLIDGVQNGVTATVNAITAGSTEMETGTAAAADTAEALTQILTAIDGASTQIAEIAERSSVVKGASDDMLILIDDLKAVRLAASQSTEQIAAVAEGNSAATEEVSASSEEVAAQVEQVAIGAEGLGQLAEALSAQVAMFRLPSATTEDGKDGRGPELEAAA